MLFKSLDDIEDSEHSDDTACSEILIRLMSASSKIEGFYPFTAAVGLQVNLRDHRVCPAPPAANVFCSTGEKAAGFPGAGSDSSQTLLLWEHPPVCSLPHVCLGRLGQSMEKDLLVGANPPGLWLPELYTLILAHSGPLAAY